MKTETPDHGGYDPVHFRNLAAVEDRHFWFRARNNVITTLVSQIVNRLSRGYRVLEIGCGNGNVLRHLERVCRDGTVIGMDMFGEGLQCARERCSCALVRADARSSPFGAKFHIIGTFDVLEHIPDDRRVLRDIFQLLEDNGALLITVPAHRTLWSSFDEASHHCRRYEMADLRSRLLEVGFEVEFLTQYMACIYPLVWFTRKFWFRRTGSADHVVARELQLIPVVNFMLSHLLLWEGRAVQQRRRLPFGTSIVAVARKPPITAQT